MRQFRLCEGHVVVRAQDLAVVIGGQDVRRAEQAGITMVIENIETLEPATRHAMRGRFATALSIDTGHAQLARGM